MQSDTHYAQTSHTPVTITEDEYFDEMVKALEGMSELEVIDSANKATEDYYTIPGMMYKETLIKSFQEYFNRRYGQCQLPRHRLSIR